MSSIEELQQYPPANPPSTAPLPPYSNTKQEPTVIVVNVPPTPVANTGPVCPPNYIAWSVFSILFLCPICGIIALVYSYKVDKEWEAGRHEAARNASKAAIWLNILSFVGGIMLYIGLLIAPIAIVA